MMAVNDNMTPELALSLQLKILNVDRVGEIIKQRLKYRALLSNNPTVDIYKEFISSETAILKEIKNARCNEYESNKKKSATSTAGRKIFGMYKEAISRFKEDKMLWVQCFAFGTEFELKYLCEPLIERMLHAHPKEVRFWRLATDFYADKPDIARRYYYRAFHYFNDDKDLHQGLFELEIKEAEKSGSRDYTNAKFVYLNSVKCITKVEFFKSLITIAQHFDFTVELQKKMVTDLMKIHGIEESVYDFLAQREKNGYHFDKVEDYTEDPHIRKINRCIEVYKQGILRIGTQKMWHYYLDALITMELRVDFCENAFKEAHELGYLTEQYYIKWQQLIVQYGASDSMEFVQLLQLGTDTCPRSVDLWKNRIQYYISQDNYEMVKALFTEGVRLTGLDSYPLWRLKLLYHLTRLPITFKKVKKTTKNRDAQRKMLQVELENFYDEACRQPEPISHPFKCLYIDWINLNKGIVATRKVYNEIARYEPHSFDLHLKMVHLETVQLKLHKLNDEKSLLKIVTTDYTEHLRAVHKFAVEQFGSIGTDAWINYMKFEMSWGCPKFVKDIYAYAQAMLPPEYMKVFESEYTALLNGLPVGLPSGSGLP